MQGKIELNRMKRGYFKVPIELLFVGLNSYELSVYVFMASCKVGFNPSARFMSKKLKISTGTVTKAIKSLIKKNIIEKIQQGELGKRSEYRFVPPTQWEIL
jgi:predicted transcriptional regulator